MNKVIFEDIDCINGCKRNDLLLTSSKDFIHGSEGEFNVVECLGCGLIRTNPRPTANTIGYYYPDNYGPYQGVKSSHKINPIKKFIKNLTNKIKYYGFEFPSHQGKMLEIGSGSGDFLIKMKKLGWEVEGLEYSEKAAQAALNHGIKMHIGPLELIDFDKDNIFDLIYGWMVIEHLYQPLESLKKLNKLTHDNSLLYFAVPNINSFDYYIFRKYWYAFHLPNHLFHFSEKTFRQIAKDAGFDIVEVHYFRGMKDTFASFSNFLQDNKMGGLSRFFMKHAHHANVIFYPIGYLLSVLRLSSRMVFVLKKNNQA